MKHLIHCLVLAVLPALAMAADFDLRGKKIFVVSDSLTNEEDGNWLALARKARPETTWVAEAHGGWSTRSYFKSKFDGVAFAKVPKDADVLIVLMGSNNLFEAGGGTDESVAEATDGVRQIVAHVRKLSPSVKEVMLVAPPTVALKNVVVENPKPSRRVDDHSPAFLEKLGRSYRELAAREGWRCVELFPLLNDDDYLDVAHPNPAGNQKVAEAILRGFGN